MRSTGTAHCRVLNNLCQRKALNYTNITLYISIYTWFSRSACVLELLTPKTIRAIAYRLRLATWKAFKLTEKKKKKTTTFSDAARSWEEYCIAKLVSKEKRTIVKALRQLVNTTLIVEFRVIQFTIDLQQSNYSSEHL